MSTMRVEDAIQAVRWKLGIVAAGEDPEPMRRLWAEFERNPDQVRQISDMVAYKISRTMVAALRRKLTGEPHPRYDWAYELADVFADWVKANGPAVSPHLAGALRDALLAKPRTAVPSPPEPTGANPGAGASKPPPRLAPPALVPPALVPPALVPHPAPPPNVLTKAPGVPPALAREYATPAPIPMDAIVLDEHPPPGPQTATSMWQYLPPPTDPDPHTESDARPMDSAPAGTSVFGARVRGKKHKHDGTNGDDWFEFAQAGPWTIVAVSDGAGSKKFSRVGAKAACEAAVRGLTTDLAEHQLNERGSSADWSVALKAEGGKLAFADDVDAVRRSLHHAFRRALDAVSAATSERSDKPEYETLLGRPIEIGDLSATLLLAVHCPVVVGGRPLGFVMACQVGDGLIGVIHPDGRGFPLGTADSGGYSGETEFLTSSGKLDAAYLDGKTAPYVGQVRSVLVMTDGVADDYFPADPGLSRLWADLTLNGIAPVPAVEPAAGVPTNFGYEAELVEAATPRRKVTLRTAEALADRVGVAAHALAGNPAVLAAASVPLAGATSHERLRTWLDAYHVRGSFDDRTLVVVHREGGS